MAPIRRRSFPTITLSCGAASNRFRRPDELFSGARRTDLGSRGVQPSLTDRFEWRQLARFAARGGVVEWLPETSRARDLKRAARACDRSGLDNFLRTMRPEPGPEERHGSMRELTASARGAEP